MGNEMEDVWTMNGGRMGDEMEDVWVIKWRTHGQ